MIRHNLLSFFCSDVDDWQRVERLGPTAGMEDVVYERASRLVAGVSRQPEGSWQRGRHGGAQQGPSPD